MACRDCKKLLFPRHKTMSGSEEMFRRKRCLSQLKKNSTSCGICATLATLFLAESLALYKAECDGSSGTCRDAIILFVHLGPSSGSAGTYALSIRVGRLDKQLREFPEPLLASSPRVSSDFLIIPMSRKHDICGDKRLDIARSTGDIAALDTAKFWLTGCEEGHDLCRRISGHRARHQRGDVFVPTRLVRILPQSLQLHVTTTAIYRYATLSHRWPLDGSQIARLTTANIHQWQVSINQEASFPQTFRDATEVCRHLGIEYLWVDSLCIIQDGDGGTDWQHESSRMGDVYESAICNIAATACVDGEDSLRNGFFRHRDPCLVQPAIITSPCDLSAVKQDKLIDATVHAANQPQTAAEAIEYFVVPLTQMAKQVVDAPLNRRAWVMQERYLSPRILHFTEEKIWFECHETITSETYPINDPVERYHNSTKSMHLAQANMKEPTPSRLPVCLTNRPEDIYQLWYEHVAIYSRAGLTKSSDKLVALSGVARAIQAQGGDIPEMDYLAGIWRKSLPHGLLWHTEDLPEISKPESQVQEKFAYQAPSWSWASLNTPVRYNYSLYLLVHEQLAKVETIQVTPLTGDAFAQVKDNAYLDISGILLNARLRYHHTPGTGSNHWEVQVVSRDGAAKFSSSRRGFAILPDDRHLYESHGFSDVKLLPMLRSKGGSISSEEPTAWMVILMLVRAGDSKLYRRFGLIELASYEQEGTKDIAILENVVKGGREELIRIV